MIKMIPIMFDEDVGNLSIQDVPCLPDDLGEGRTYYVSSRGCDERDGLSPENAFRSIDKINQMQFRPGDSILFRRGDTFYGAHVTLHGSGDPQRGQWITLDAYGEGEDPKLLGTDPRYPAISLQDPSVKGGYRIRHLHLEGYHLGIAAARGSAAEMLEDLEISYCTLRHITTGRDFDPRPTLPCGAPLAFGMWLHYVRRVHVHHVTIEDTDCPLQFCGGNANFDRMDIRESHIQGVMLYGIRDVHTYEEIMAAEGHVTLCNSRILYTGDRATKFGSTGCLIENIHHCRLCNVEVGYTVNTLGIFDACAVDWEQSNVECSFVQVFAHDNQGPFILAMEHPESAGISRGNVVKDCLSYHNGTFGMAAGNSFIDYSSYSYEHQRIRIEDCVDIAEKGVAPYAPVPKEQALHSDGTRGNFPLDVRSLATYTLEVKETFDDPVQRVFSKLEKGGIRNACLVLEAGGLANTFFTGQNYCVDLELRGDAEVSARCNEGGDRYYIRRSGQQAFVGQVLSGKDTLLYSYPCSGRAVDDLYRVGMVCDGDTVAFYLDRSLVAEVTKTELQEGSVLLTTPSYCSVSELRICPMQVQPRQKDDFSEGLIPCEGGSLGMDSAHGEYGFFSPEINWRSRGLWYWEYRPFRTGWGIIGDHDATLTREGLHIDASQVQGVQVVMLNATYDPVVYLEYTTDGEHWHGKELLTAYRQDPTVNACRKPYPQMRAYRVDMTEDPNFHGVIRGLRLRFGAGCGIIALQGMTLYTSREKG